MSGGCPSCGVAVIPGYVKCPRCHAVLPGAGRSRRSGLDPGGTSVEERSFPIIPVAIGGIAVAVVLLLVFGGGGEDRKVPPAEGAAVEGAAGEGAAGVGAPVEAVPANTAPAPQPLEIPGNTGPNPGAVAAELERALGRQRLWSSVQASGDRVDVRSGSCAEPAMGSTIDAARAALRGAGLTRLRCLAQSGAVVFERDL